MRCSSAAGSAPGGSTSWLISIVPDAVLKPTSVCSGFPSLSLSATTKISFRDRSMTGVPVMPAVGVISPQGSDPAGTGLPSWVDQVTAPVAADSA